MDLILLLIAAALYSTGGLLMKYSQGLSNLRPTIGFVGLLFALPCSRAARCEAPTSGWPIFWCWESKRL